MYHLLKKFDTLLKKIENIIVNSRFYNIIRFNFLSEFIIETLQKKTDNNVAFYQSFLPLNNNNKLIFDVGANKGNKIKAFLQMGFSVIAFEPEKKSLETLRWRYKNNKKVTIVPVGISNEEGKLTMHVTQARSGYNTLSNEWVESLENENTNRWKKKHIYKQSYEVEVKTLDQMIDKYGLPLFIKIDVEGFELQVLKGLHTLPQYLSFECNLPEFKIQTIEILNHIEQINKNIEYNFSVQDKPLNNHWITHQELLSFINKTQERYLEIICKKL